MAHRIPRTIRLPFGYIIRVRQVTLAEMREAIDWDEGEDEADGCWVEDDMTIYILRTLPLRRRRYLVCHELQHAATDLLHQQLDDGVGRP